MASASHIRWKPLKCVSTRVESWLLEMSNFVSLGHVTSMRAIPGTSSQLMSFCETLMFCTSRFESVMNQRADLPFSGREVRQ